MPIVDWTFYLVTPEGPVARAVVPRLAHWQGDESTLVTRVALTPNEALQLNVTMDSLNSSLKRLLRR